LLEGEDVLAADVLAADVQTLPPRRHTRIKVANLMPISYVMFDANGRSLFL
jgi:hypothetical protein